MSLVGEATVRFRFVGAQEQDPAVLRRHRLDAKRARDYRLRRKAKQSIYQMKTSSTEWPMFSNVKETTDYMIPDARQFSFGLEGRNASVPSNINFVWPLRPSEIKVKRK